MIRLDSNMLHSAVKSVMPALPSRRNCLPIIDNILIEGNGKLELTATNLELTIWRKLEIQSEQDFTVAVKGRSLEALCKNASGEITLSVPESGKLHIEDGAGSKDVTAWPDYGDFPIEPFVIGERLAESEIELKWFTEACKPMIEKTGDNEAHNLDCLHFNKGRIEATNGHVLDHKTVAWLPDDVKALIPYDSMKRILKSLDTVKKGNPCMTIDWYSKGLLIQCKDLYIKVKTRDGDFPDINKVIPMKTGDPCVFNREALVKALKQVKMFNGERNKCVKILVEDNKAILRCDHPDLGYGQTRIDYTGSPELRFVGLNADYLMDALKSAKGDSVTVQITAATDAILVNDEVIMPMRDACGPDDRDRMREAYGKPAIPELTEDQEHDWLADVDEKYYTWKWNRKGSMFAGTWRVKVAA